MKVGILTFHRAHNYGAVLQCYALYKTITLLGHNVKVIDYAPSYIASKRPCIFRAFINRRPYNLIENLKRIREGQINYDGYKNFERDNIEKTRRVVTNDDLLKICNIFDYIVVGSDQIWNNKYNGDDDAWFGLNGKTNNKLKWITYAASAGDPQFSATEIKKFKNRLSNFSAISLREQKLEGIVKLLIPRSVPIQTVLDPSLLADPNIYSKWMASIISEPYILTYQARESSHVFNLARNLANQMGITRIIPIDRYQSVIENGFPIPHYTPTEFISLIKNAGCVVTTSFHGTAFSIIFNTPFYTVKLNDGADERSENLLKETGLLDRFIADGNFINFSIPNFSFANNNLVVLRQNSRKFLVDNLK